MSGIYRRARSGQLGTMPNDYIVTATLACALATSLMLFLDFFVYALIAAMMMGLGYVYGRLADDFLERMEADVQVGVVGSVVTQAMKMVSRTPTPDVTSDTSGATPAAEEKVATGSAG